ncbi:CWC25 spliceosome associated protein homolog isoform X2 [Arctopsyche grandis]
MDWMYKEPNQGLDREQYLLGKAIDKTFEKIATTEQSQLNAPPKNHVEHECIPFSIRNLKNKNSTFEGQVDIARKLLEDPLVAIRKREVESRTQLLQNPVKLKEISMLLKAEQQKHKKKKEKKKSKKNKKNKADLEEKIVEKLKKLGGSDGSININKLLSSSELLDDLKRQTKKKRKKSSKHSSSDSSSESESESDERDRRKSKKDEKSSKSKKKRAVSSEERDKSKDRYEDSKKSTRRHGSSHRDKDRNESVKHNRSEKELYTDRKSHNPKFHGDKNYGLVRADGSKIEIDKKKYNDKDKFDHKLKENPKKWQRPERKQMSEKEMEEKRREMMDNATKRDYQREKNVARYRVQEKQLELKEKQEDFREDFVEKHLRIAAGQSSVESRIKSNIYNIQRSNRDMDKHFAKR